MGARLGKHAGGRRVAVEERFCKPSGTFTNLRNIDGNRLRTLIQTGKLSPCYPGLEEPPPGESLEECPICFLHYPALNRSKCCQKGLCTECFLQVKAPPNQQVACPFCKELGYAVVYRGKKSAEELQRELLDDQRVIEARIRARQSEAAERGTHSRTPSSSAVAVPAPASPASPCATLATSPTPPSTPLTALPLLSPGGSFRAASSGGGGGLDERDEARRRAAFLATSGGGGGGRGGASEADVRRLGRLADHLPPALLARTRASDIDLEDLMLMEAIWRSLQTQPEAGAPPAAPAPAAAPPAPATAPQAEAANAGTAGTWAEALRAARAAQSESEEDEFEEDDVDVDDHDATEDDDSEAPAASTADASPNAPTLSEAEMQRAMSLPREPGMMDVDVARGLLSRRASDVGGPRLHLRRRSSNGMRMDSELEQLRNWGAHATPAAAAAAEEEMLAMAMRLSLAEVQPPPPPAAEDAAAAPSAPSPMPEPDPDAGQAAPELAREPDPDAAVVASLVASAVTAAAAAAAAEAPPAPEAAS